MASTVESWRPLARGELAGRMDAVVCDIAEALLPWRDRSQLNLESLGFGDTGIALFFHYLERSPLGAPYRGLAEAFLERAFRAAEQQEMGSDLYGGITGTAWVHEHMFRHATNDDTLDAADDMLVDLLARDKWTQLYGLNAGLVGIGVYALERWPGGRSREILECVVRHLLAQLEPAVVGATCFTPNELLLPAPAKVYPRGYYNLGVAHGVPGVTGILAAAARLGVGGGPAVAGARDTAHWILSCRLADATGPAFPSTVGFVGEQSLPRLGWCYGDAGVAGVLLCAAHLLRDEDMAHQARAAARHAACVPAENTGVGDAQLCHGAVGLAHIFNRFAQATGEQILADAALSWYERALAYRQQGIGIAGFQSLGAKQPQESIGFLRGAAGIGLALLAATHDMEPAWDRLLLLSSAV